MWGLCSNISSPSESHKNLPQCVWLCVFVRVCVGPGTLCGCVCIRIYVCLCAGARTSALAPSVYPPPRRSACSECVMRRREPGLARSRLMNWTPSCGLCGVRAQTGDSAAAEHTQFARCVRACLRLHLSLRLCVLTCGAQMFGAAASICREREGGGAQGLVFTCQPRRTDVLRGTPRDTRKEVHRANGNLHINVFLSPPFDLTKGILFSPHPTNLISFQLIGRRIILGLRWRRTRHNLLSVQQGKCARPAYFIC